MTGCLGRGVPGDAQQPGLRKQSRAREKVRAGYALRKGWKGRKLQPLLRTAASRGGFQDVGWRKLEAKESHGPAVPRVACPGTRSSLVEKVSSTRD